MQLYYWDKRYISVKHETLYIFFYDFIKTNENKNLLIVINMRGCNLYEIYNFYNYINYYIYFIRWLNESSW